MKLHSDPRHIARELALKTLFEWMFYSREPKDILQESLDRLAEENSGVGSLKIKKDLAQRLLRGVIKNQKEIDETIKISAPEWPIEQIAYIDLAILRLAIFELNFLKTEPEKAIIDEAVELAKEFGGDNSGKFVNGVLGTILEKTKSTDLDDKQSNS